MHSVDLNFRSTFTQFKLATFTVIALFCITACCSSEYAKEYANVIENTVIMAIFNKPPISGVKIISICSSS